MVRGCGKFYHVDGAEGVCVAIDVYRSRGAGTGPCG